MLYHVRDSLQAAADDKPQSIEDDDDDSDAESCRPTPSVIRIAAHAGVLLIDKYMDLTWHCEIYIISLGVLLSIYI